MSTAARSPPSTLPPSPGPAGNGPWATYLDISHLSAETSAGAVGGVKVWVNNAGYDAPSIPDRDITDTNDGQINIEGTGQFTGLVNLQGRAKDTGGILQVYNQALKAGATLLAQGISASSGLYTTVSVGGNTLTIGSTLLLGIDRVLYLPTTVAVGTSYADSHTLDARPSTSLNTVLLLGGDATNDDVIEILDAACIGNDYGKSGGFTVCGGSGTSDVNEDGVVDILDMALMGGNLDLAASPWIP